MASQRLRLKTNTLEAIKCLQYLLRGDSEGLSAAIGTAEVDLEGIGDLEDVEG
jgi:hypothetical protein